MKKNILKTINVLIPLIVAGVAGLLITSKYAQVSNLPAETVMASAVTGPGILPSWADDANVKLYIQIENLYEGIQYKHFWLSWIYEWDAYGTALRSTTNLNWYPVSLYDNFDYQEHLYDGSGIEIPMTLHEQGVYARGIMSVDIMSNPEYEDIWLGLFNSNKRILEVYIMTQSVEEPAPEEIGPGTLPDWHLDAQVQLGWVFEDPINPQYTDPLPDWSKAIDDIPVWDYLPDREYNGAPAQWYINIPNIINEQPSKKVWISCVYEYNSSIADPQCAINIDWTPNTGMSDPWGVNEYFDSARNLITDSSQAVYGRMTGGLNIYPNPIHEELWLGLPGDSKNILEVYIKTLCSDDLPPEPEPEEIGPGALPDWHLDAQVQLGWVFEDPTNPQDTGPLPDWSKAIDGIIPIWDYLPDREYNGDPAQWHIQIPNINNDNPSKKVWISCVYEYDSSIIGAQYALNISWYPNTGMDNPMVEEELFDINGNPTIVTSEAVYGRVTGSLDLYPNPEYEDIWLGLYGDSKNVLEVYIKTLCVEEIEPEPETEINVAIDTLLSFIANENTELRQVIKVTSSSTEIKIIIDIKQEGNEVPEYDLRIKVSGGVADTDISIDIGQSDGTTNVKVSLDVTLVGSSNDIDVSVDISQSGSFTDFVLDTDIHIGA